MHRFKKPLYILGVFAWASARNPQVTPEVRNADLKAIPGSTAMCVEQGGSSTRRRSSTCRMSETVGRSCAQDSALFFNIEHPVVENIHRATGIGAHGATQDAE